jgi:cytochrome c oxidase subunit 1
MLTRTPGLFALGFTLVLLVGGTAGLGSAQPLHDGLALGTVFAMFAGWYWWIGKLTGKPYPEPLGRLHFFLLFAGVTLMALPQGGSAGSGPALGAALGAALTALSVLVFVLVAAITLARGRAVSADPWNTGTMSPEWSLPSPVWGATR